MKMQFDGAISQSLTSGAAAEPVQRYRNQSKLACGSLSDKLPAHSLPPILNCETCGVRNKSNATRAAGH